MIICSSNNIDFIQGVVSYGNEPSITDWRIANSNGILNFFNSKSNLGNLSILENGNIMIGNATQAGSLNVYGDIDITGVYKNNSRNVITDTSNYVLSTSNISISNIRSEVRWGSNYSDLVGVWGSNYSDRIGGWGSNYSDLVGVWGSNYVSRVFANVGSGGGTSQWISSNANIYYNTSNVGIGTFNPVGNLHVYNNITPPKIIIQDGKIGDNTGFPADIIASGTAGTTTTTIGTTDKCTTFTNTGATQTTYTITIPTGGLICDVLVVGGGGCGGRSGGGGGGVLYTTNVFFPAGSYTLRVGNGGISIKTGGVGNTQGANGEDSEIVFSGTTIFRAKGGGFGAANNPSSGGSLTGGTGGSGGGSENLGNVSLIAGNNIISTNTSSSLFTTSINQTPNSSTIYGNVGSKGGVHPNYYYYLGGSGGGAGGVGGAYNLTTHISGAGGLGISIDITGSSIKYGSGGSGGIYNDRSIGGASQATPGAVDSGGGTGAYTINNTSVPGSVPTTGRGGGSGGWGFNGQTGENIYCKDGGSGVIIIRFRKVFITASSIDFVRGTDADGNRDYSIGNYIGEFKILSRTFNTESTFFRIAENGTMYNAQGTTNFTSASDMRVKENIEVASYDKCYENIHNLGLYRFNYIKNFNNINKDTKQLGFIAQEVKEYFPKAVSFNNYINEDVNIGDLLTLDVSQINYTLYGAVKKLMEMNEYKEARIKRLETLLNLEPLPITSNLPIDTSNLQIDTSNISIDTSNISLDTINISIDTSNIAIDTSNIAFDTSNLPIDTSNLPIDTSNLPIDTSNLNSNTSNIEME
jgi:hypothetical protein